MTYPCKSLKVSVERFRASMVARDSVGKISHSSNDFGVDAPFYAAAYYYLIAVLVHIIWLQRVHIIWLQREVGQ